MLASSPTTTSPMITAVGATNALGEIRGALPLYSIIMRHPPYICITIFDVTREINNGRRTCPHPNPLQRTRHRINLTKKRSENEFLSVCATRDLWIEFGRPGIGAKSRIHFGGAYETCSS